MDVRGLHQGGVMDLRSLRKAAKLTQTEAGELVGVGRRTIWNYENNVTPIPKAARIIFEKQLGAKAKSRKGKV